MNLEAEILKGLADQFGFRKTRGEWLQEGKCPQCGKHEAWTAAKDPKMVKCGRADRCGWEDTVRNLLPDLFEDWSKRFPPSEENPTAAADAYLSHERGLDLQFLRGTYSQEVYQDYGTKQTGATVRFPIGDSWWERIIDRPGRFDRKAHFKPKAPWRGHCWLPNQVTFESLAQAEEIWITEGVFDATALTMVGKPAVSNMSTNPYPEHFLAQLRQALQESRRPTRPKLVFAFDVGAAGTTYTRKHVAKAREEGWEATAAQVKPDGEGSKLDWNDLLLRHQAYRGDPERAPLGPKAFAEYLYNGAITIAESPAKKARLIADHHMALSSFYFRWGNRLFWGRVKVDEEGGRQIDHAEVCNCSWRLLYRERDEIADETYYYLQVDFPEERFNTKARFSSAACANSAEFKKRLMAFAGMWKGTGEQLDRMIGDQTRQLKVVEPVPFTGYSPKHGAWLLGDLAVQNGRLLKVNAEDYFDVGKYAVKLRSAERLLDIEYDPDKIAFDWLDAVWSAYGPKGLITVAFFAMSLFAVQIRKTHKSIGFLEITGQPGSGKSTLVEFCWKLFGRAGYEGFDPNKATKAALARNLVKVSNMPVGLIEGRRGDDDQQRQVQQFDFNELLVLYNGRSPRSIGRKSGGNETDEPPFHGTIYLMQNERIDAIPAVLERLMSMGIDKSRWTAATREAAVKLEQWPIEELSGTIVHIVRNEGKFLPFFFDRFKHHDADMPDRVEGLYNTRPIKCHSQLAAAVDALPHLFPRCRPEWVQEAIAEIDRMALDRQQACGGDHPLVADFWEKFDWLESRGDGQWDETKSINRHRKFEELIAVNLPHFESRCKAAGLNAPDMARLKKLLGGSKSRKFVGRNVSVNTPSGVTERCWVFQQPKKAEDPII